MRVVIVGKTGFLARHILSAAQAEGLEASAIAHDSELDAAFRGASHIANCAMHPDLRVRDYREELDFDRKIAGLARQSGASFIMLSSRSVYRDGWNAREDDQASGNGTIYGRNKAVSEEAVRATGVKCTILRLSNIFGHELGRHTFLGQLQTSLKASRKIVFDMSPATRRDFLPVEAAATMITRLIKSGRDGVFNLGCGVPIACGDIAAAVIDGFGRGELVVTDDRVRDEFFLNMDKSAGLGIACQPELVLQRCRAIGQSLHG